MRTACGQELALKTYDDGAPDWGWPIFVGGNEFGPVYAIRAQSFGDAYDIYLDEFATREEWDDLPPECQESWERGESCECHEFAPNGGMRQTGPYDWIQPIDAFRNATFIIAEEEVA